MLHLWQDSVPFFWQAVCDQLSPFLLFLLLCSSISSRFSLPAQFLWILLSSSYCRDCPIVSYSSPIFSLKFKIKVLKVRKGFQSDPSQAHGWHRSSPPPQGTVHSYEGVLASYLPTTAEPLPFSCLGEEHPGVGPLYGEELLLVEVGRCRRDRERGRGVSDGVVRESRSRSGGRKPAEGVNGNASGNPVM